MLLSTHNQANLDGFQKNSTFQTETNTRLDN